MTVFALSANADWLYIHELANTVHLYGTLSGQDVPTAPYYFPDLLVFSGLRFLSSNPTISNALYSIGFCAVLGTFIYFLFRLCGLPCRRALLSACLTVLTFTILPPFNPDATKSFPFFLKTYSASHTAAACLSLAALAFYLRIRGAGIKWIYISAAFLIALFAYISDLILFSYLTCPIVFLALSDWLIGRLSLRATAIVLITTLAPLAINIGARPTMYEWLGLTSTIPFSFHPTLSAAALHVGLKNFTSALQRALLDSPLFYSQIFFLYALCTIASIESFCRGRPVHTTAKSDGNLRSAIVFFVAAQASTLGSGIVLNTLSHPDLFRYIIPIYLFPIILAYLFLARQLSSTRLLTRRLAMATMICIPAANIMLLALTSHERLRNINIEAPYPEWLQCVDTVARTHGLTAGLAAYWDTRPARMLTRSNIQIAQIDESLDVNFLTDNQRSLFNADGTVRDFQFVLARGIAGVISPDKVIEQFGRPEAVEQCPPWRNAVLARMEPGPVMMIYTSRAAHSELNAVVSQRAASYRRKRERVYTLGTNVDFSVGGNAAPYLQQGWSSRESDGTWTIGSLSRIAMSLEGGPLSDDLTLSVRAKAFNPPARKTQTVTVAVNGKAVARWTFAAGDTSDDRTALIPASLRTPDRPINISFVVDDVRSPSELMGVQGDDRKLGLFVSALRLEVKKD